MNTATAIDAQLLKNYYCASSLTLTQSRIELGIETELEGILAKEFEQGGLSSEIYCCF